MEGHQNDDDADLLEQIGLDINESYFDLLGSRDWYWTRAVREIAHAGGNALTLDSDIYAVRYIRTAGDELLEPRQRAVQNDYKKYYVNKALRTYALDGHDATTGGLVLRFEPEESAGTFTVGCNVLPGELAADSDRPLGPPDIGAYLVWYTRWLRLMGDEERPTLIGQTQARWEMILQRLVHNNTRSLKSEVVGPLPMP